MTKNIFKNLHKLFLSLFGRKPKVFVTFNGIGAFTYALKLLGIEIGEQVYCELNDAANKTYRFNNKFKNSKFVNDINKLLELVKRGEKCDLLVQSPECQSFSQQGKRLGLESLSGNLFLTAIKLQKKIDSSIVIYENVKGLITHEKFIYTYEKENGEQFQTRKNIGKKKLKKRKLKEISKVEDSYSSLINPLYDGKKKSIGLTFRVIEEQLLEDDRYNYYWKIINAADQGIPQARERIIIIGIKKEIDGGFKFPENIELQFTVEDILETNVDESYIYKNENNHELVLSNSPKRKNQIYTYGKYKGVKYDSDSRVLNPYVASTILTGNNTKFKIDDVIRKLTPNENKKLNGFDDEFQFPVCKTAANKQNGNTVVSWVYARVFESLLNSIKPANSDTKFIKKELVGKYSMNYHFMREEIANEYMDFISNGGKVVVQIDKYNSKEDKKQKINHQTYFIEVEEFEKLSLINPKYNIHRYKIKGKVSKYLFAYEDRFLASNLKTKEIEEESRTQIFNNTPTIGCKKDTVIGKINYKNKIVKKYVDKLYSIKTPKTSSSKVEKKNSFKSKNIRKNISIENHLTKCDVNLISICKNFKFKTIEKLQKNRYLGFPINTTNSNLLEVVS